MGTSQAKIARIEGGEENVTLRTVKKIADALFGRLTLTLQPADLQLPRLPQWWEYPTGAPVAWGGGAPVFKSMITIQQDTGASIGALWDSASTGVTSNADVGKLPPDNSAIFDSATTAQYTFEVKAITEEPARRFLATDIASALDETA